MVPQILLVLVVVVVNHGVEPVEPVLVAGMPQKLLEVVEEQDREQPMRMVEMRGPVAEVENAVLVLKARQITEAEEGAVLPERARPEEAVVDTERLEPMELIMALLLRVMEALFSEMPHLLKFI